MVLWRSKYMIYMFLRPTVDGSEICWAPSNSFAGLSHDVGWLFYTTQVQDFLHQQWQGWRFPFLGRTKNNMYPLRCWETGEDSWIFWWMVVRANPLQLWWIVYQSCHNEDDNKGSICFLVTGNCFFCICSQEWLRWIPKRRVWNRDVLSKMGIWGIQYPGSILNLRIAVAACFKKYWTGRRFKENCQIVVNLSSWVYPRNSM